MTSSRPSATYRRIPLREQADRTRSPAAPAFLSTEQRSASTDSLLDGGENVDAYTSKVGQSVPLDSVQEFSVVSNNFSAEYGRASGGVINVVTKSGTNQFHGSLYEFNRISASRQMTTIQMRTELRAQTLHS